LWIVLSIILEIACNLFLPIYACLEGFSIIYTSRESGLIRCLFLFLVGIHNLPARNFEGDLNGFKEKVFPFLETYCMNCHDEDIQKGELRFDTIDGDLVNGKDAEHWKDALHRLEVGEMPPEDKKQPDPALRDEVAKWIRGELNKHFTVKLGVPGRVVMRRLNRDEYRNTIKDLLGLPYEVGLTLPPDINYKGFENVGTVQELSPEQLEQYLNLARFAIENVIVSPKERPFSVQYRMHPEKVRDGAEYIVETHGNPEQDKAYRSLFEDNKKIRLPKELGEWTVDTQVFPVNYQSNTIQSVELDPTGKGCWLRASDVLNINHFNPWGRFSGNFGMMPKPMVSTLSVSKLEPSIHTIWGIRQ
jgi:hypothetical protein